MVHRLMVVAGENDDIRELPSQLADNDIEATLFDNANDALWEMRGDPPEVVIASTELPDMNGLDMAEILPSFDLPTQMVLWSPEDSPALRDRVASLAVCSLLVGQVSGDELLATIREALSRADAARTEIAARQAEPKPEPEPEPEPEPVPAAPSRSARREPVASEPASPARAEPERAAPARPRARNERFAARAADAAERQHDPGTAPAGHAHGSRRGGGNLVLTADNLNPIRSIMSQLAQELGPQCILLTDRAGMVLVDVGTTDSLPTMILLPLLSTSFSTAGEVARQLGEEDAMTLYIHEGLNYDLYCFDISQRFLLVLVFNKKVASSKIGAVWVNTKRAIRELQEALS